MRPPDEIAAGAAGQDVAGEAAGATTAQTPKRELVGQFATSLLTYLRTETGGAGLLLAATVIALVWANSPIGDTYDDVWHLEVRVGAGGLDFGQDLRHWVNDGLMVLFFFVIGLELRRQLTIGELTDRRQVTIPALAAIAGLVVPIAVYLAFNSSGEAARGWGVAMATDTAFLLGALALVGPAFPAQLRVFLLSMSVVDDIGALLAIAVFYSEDVHPLALLGVAACAVAIVLLGRLNVWRGPAYLIVGVGMWISLIQSGVHPTLGGVIVGLLMSVYPPRREEVERAGALARAFGQSPLPELARSAKLSVERAVSPNERLQALLHPWTSFVIVPIFALANAGVVIDGELVERALASPVTHGVVAGLVLGKLVGIGLVSTIAVRFGLGRLPTRVRLGEVWGGAALAGMGFTISLFVVDLAFDSPELADEARIGVLAASALAALAGWAIFALDRRLARGDVQAPITRLDRPVDPERDHVRGPVDAPLTLVEYGDFECPFCGRATGAVTLLRERLGDDLRYVFRHLPLTDVHAHAQLAAEAAEAAAAQGAFWPMHDRLFAHQDELEPADLLEHAAELGLDLERFARDLGSGTHADRVREDVASAEASGAEGTPTFFANGQRVLGRWDADALAAALLAGRDTPSGVATAASGSGDGQRRRDPTVSRLPVLGRTRLDDADQAEAARPLELDDLAETPDDGGVFPRLTPAQIATLEPFGARRWLDRGEPLYPRGETGADFVVVISGAIAMVDGFGGANRVNNVHGRGRFLGELGILTGQPTLLTPVGQQPSEVLVVPTDRLDDALATDPALRDLVLRSYLLRRSRLIGLAAELRIIGYADDEDARRLRAFAARHEVPHSWTDLAEDEQARTLLDDLGVRADETPVALTRSGTLLRDPTDDELADALGIDAAGDGDGDDRVEPAPDEPRPDAT